MTKKIVITGPESTGKTTLASLLSEHYQMPKVAECARDYLNHLERDYTFDDVILMAKKQLKLESEATKNNTDFIFLDTDLLVFKIWIKEKYNKEIDWIEEHLKSSTGKTYLLCDIDIPWEFDELREHPNPTDRLRLFEAYKTQLNNYQLTYHVISGNVKERMDKCISIFTTFKND